MLMLHAQAFQEFWGGTRVPPTVELLKRNTVVNTLGSVHIYSVISAGCREYLNCTFHIYYVTWASPRSWDVGFLNPILWVSICILLFSPSLGMIMLLFPPHYWILDVYSFNFWCDLWVVLKTPKTGALWF